MTIGPDFETVLAGAQAGAEWAFGIIYRDLNKRVIRYLSVYAPSAAEDLAADTWMAVARRLGSFNGGEDAFRAWLFTIARRQLIQHWRSSSRRPTTVFAPGTMPDRTGPDDPEAAGVANLTARDAVAAIGAALPPDQADVVLLRLVADLDVDQVAQLLGKRPGTVRALQHKALRRLAQKISTQSLTDWATSAIDRAR
jgi:RNA polymerase sigma-70 factor (ECF subfamily)